MWPMGLFFILLIVLKHSKIFLIMWTLSFWYKVFFSWRLDIHVVCVHGYRTQKLKLIYLKTGEAVNERATLKNIVMATLFSTVYRLEH